MLPLLTPLGQKNMKHVENKMFHLTTSTKIGSGLGAGRRGIPVCLMCLHSGRGATNVGLFSSTTRRLQMEETKKRDECVQCICISK